LVHFINLEEGDECVCGIISKVGNNRNTIQKFLITYIFLVYKLKLWYVSSFKHLCYYSKS